MDDFKTKRTEPFKHKPTQVCSKWFLSEPEHNLDKFLFGTEPSSIFMQ